MSRDHDTHSNDADDRYAGPHDCAAFADHDIGNNSIAHHPDDPNEGAAGNDHAYQDNR
jgi:hypothetical protein